MGYPVNLFDEGSKVVRLNAFKSSSDDVPLWGGTIMLKWRRTVLEVAQDANFVAGFCRERSCFLFQMKDAQPSEWFLLAERVVVCTSAKSKWKHANKLWQNMMPCLCTLLGNLPNCLCPMITLKLELKDVVVVVAPRVPQSLKNPTSLNSSSFNHDVLYCICLFPYTHIHCSLTCLYNLSAQFFVMYCPLTPKTSRPLVLSEASVVASVLPHIIWWEHF